MSFISKGLIEFEEYAIDRARWQLSWRGEPLPLNRKTFDLLLYLVEHSDRVIGKDELLRKLWPESFVEESNLTQHIFLLRKALSRHESGGKIIETIPGRGYRFTATVKAVETEQRPDADRMVISASESIARITFEEEVETSEPVPRELATDQPLLPPPSRKSRSYWIAGSAVAAAVLCVAGWFGWQRWLDRTGGAPVNVVLAATDGTTGDPVLDTALVEALRIDLAQSPFVSLVPGATVRATLTEMMHKPDDPVTAELAREICERTNSQAVIHGAIARDGTHFLLTEEVSNCVDGKALAGVTHEAVNAEDLPHSIDELAEGLRQKLGESRRSISRFSTPLFHVNTASLDALKAFSQGVQQMRAGRLSKAIPLFKAAIAADPQFASAYYNMAAAYVAAGNDTEAQAALEKAYSLRETAAKPSQFAIVGLYSEQVTGDLYEGLRNAENWAALYPNSAASWSGLSYAQRNLGHHAEALEGSKRTVELLPHSSGALLNLALDQMQTGDLKAARATCDRAIGDHLDGDRIRGRYLEVAHLLHDQALVQEQIAWSQAHPDSLFLLQDEASYAISEGRFSEAHKLMAQWNALKHQQGLSDADDEDSKQQALDLMQSGDIEEGKKVFKRTPVDPKEGSELVGLIYAGDSAAAQSALRTMQAKFPNGTMWNLYWGPLVEATIAMQEHRPKDAAAILEKAKPLEAISLAIPRLRGEAYLAAGQSDLAEKNFRAVIAHPELDLASPAVPLSWLDLGRALAAEGNRAAAIDAYQHFLTLWAHADPDAVYLKQAKQEFASLQKGTPAK
jgi:DNA-binding winged helix-turn-helix (wHTH) protein/tetratricopeptide (TPR) repeat protein